MHAPYAVFMTESQLRNADKHVRFIHSADTQIVPYFYCLHLMLRLCHSLVAAVALVVYKKLPLKQKKKSIGRPD